MTIFPRSSQEDAAEYKASLRRDRRRFLTVFFVLEAAIVIWWLWVWWTR